MLQQTASPRSLDQQFFLASASFAVSSSSHANLLRETTETIAPVQRVSSSVSLCWREEELPCPWDESISETMHSTYTLCLCHPSIPFPSAYIHRPS